MTGGGGAAALLCAIALAGCSVRQIGAEATRGALQAVEEKAEPKAEPEEIAEGAARELVRTGLEELTTPARREELLGLVEAASSRAARAAVEGVLGQEGPAPPAAALPGLVEEASAAAARGVRSELAVFPDCAGPDREACVDRRVHELARAASAGAVDAVRDALALPVLLLTFAAGALTALLLGWLLSRRRHFHVSG